ncbi:exopolyphosphatase / guanosine-5'-triphosphate,3'-diphosphate pyrophosphatase [Agromyces sp. CF514]|uniref:Ppx/GppA phosphatase family protein n=1 Tax=Agromyces sp. CF514 TaxID=1881031 RepID=UPI0008DFAE70|nr:Ppx/GppA phosphatase family protein [Agromyces sp. CF514]SFR73817.1 exopolyphosphatase / guanosine-5'-triphosphate,3'-diphosphate pyrophosphatase [Agromyces sp. CF514]
MRLGVLDVGSNTVHLLVVDAHPGARPIPAASHRSVLRVMRYLEPDGSIGADGVEAILTAVGDAVRVARESGIDELLAFATSAIREAANGEAVLARVTAETGVELQVLSGADEARITFLAVRRWYGWSAERILLFDIGGGSLEIANGIDEIPDVARSLPLGAGRSTIAFLPDDPPTPEQVQRLRDHAASVLRPALEEFARLPKPSHVVGSSKTIRSLARLAGWTEEGVGPDERSILRRKGLDDWIPRLARIPADARPALPGITADRTFQIVAGAVVLSEAMRAFGVNELEVSPWALREGLILRRLDRMA